jgi:hypothetical protein
MSRQLFVLLAAGVTVGGLVLVVAAAHLLLQTQSPRVVRPVAWTLLLGYAAVLLVRPSAWMAIDLAVLAGAVGGVLLLESGLRTPGAVAAFIAIAASIDLWSMSGGLSRGLVERYRDGTSNVLQYLTLVVPIRGRAVPIVGIGDLLVGGTVAVALLRLKLPPTAVVASIVCGLLVALAYGLWRGGAPALPFIACPILLLVWRHARRGSAHRVPVPRRRAGS